MPSELQRASLPPLPAGKKTADLFADFFRYLFSCASDFITETHAQIRDTWAELCADAVFVLSHPNGWEGAQQKLMRSAAIAGGLVPDTPRGRSRVVFVTEGEASLHFCVRGGFLDEVCE